MTSSGIAGAIEMNERKVTPNRSAKRKRRTGTYMNENTAASHNNVVTPLVGGRDEGNENNGRGEPIITVVLTADNHLGYAMPELAHQKQEAFQQRLRRGFQQAVDFAVGQGVDFFIQAGDLFDTVNPGEVERSFVAARLSQLRQAGVRVFAVGGTRDTPGVRGEHSEHDTRLAPQESYARLGALHYFAPTGGELKPVFVELRGVSVGICGLSASASARQHGKHGKHDKQANPLANARVPDDFESAALPLLILHGPIEGDVPMQSAAQMVISQASIKNQRNFRVIFAGGQHSYRHLRVGQSDVIIAGTTQQLDFQDAEGEAGFVFIGLAADGVRWCKHIAVDALALRRLELHTDEIWLSGETENIAAPAQIEHQEMIETADPATAPAQRVIERLKPLCDKDALVYARLEGTLTRAQYHQLDLRQVRQFGEEHCFALALDESGLDIVAGTSEKQHVAAVEIPGQERLSAREELIALADEWIAAAQEEQEKAALRATKEELLAIMDSR
jgi:exonuclease SbcD